MTVCDCDLCNTPVQVPPGSTSGWGVDEWHNYVRACLERRSRGFTDYGFKPLEAGRRPYAGAGCQCSTCEQTALELSSGK